MMTKLKEILEVSDLDQFVEMLTSWHKRKVAILEHMRTIPEGTEMEDDGHSVILTGDMLTGFKAGLQLALLELGSLPFESIEEPYAAATQA